MRFVTALVTLGACSSAPPARTPQPAPNRVAASPVAQPAPAPVTEPSLPEATRQALAAEPLTNRTVVVLTRLYQTVERARARTAPTYLSLDPVVLDVVADHGDVIEVTTAPSKAPDCIERADEPLAVRAFVRRDELLARVAIESVVPFADGTGYVIDRGAPVVVSRHGPRWYSPMLRSAEVTLPAELSYALATPYAPAPALPGGTRADVSIGRSATLQGKDVATYAARRERVVSVGDSLAAEFREPCTTVRAIVEEARSIGGAGGVPRSRFMYSIRVGAAVTWLDGSPAGTTTGVVTYDFSQVVEQPDATRWCAAMYLLETPLCYASGDVKKHY